MSEIRFIDIAVGPGRDPVWIRADCVESVQARGPDVTIRMVSGDKFQMRDTTVVKAINYIASAGNNPLPKPRKAGIA